MQLSVIAVIKKSLIIDLGRNCPFRHDLCDPFPDAMITDRYTSICFSCTMVESAFISGEALHAPRMEIPKHWSANPLVSSLLPQIGLMVVAKTPPSPK